VAAADAQARTIDKVSFVEKLCPNVHGLVLTVLVLSALKEELVALREVALIVVNDVNARGVLLEDRLWAMLAWVRMVALSRVRHGAAIALATTQLCSGHDLRLLELGFLVVPDEEETEELTGDFTTAMEAIAAATHVGDLVLTTFFEP
jgi:hypothetical protein